MPNSAKVLFRGAATTTVTTLLYTVPSATTTVITSIAVANTAASAGTFTLAIGPAGSEVLLFDAVAIAADTTTVIDLKQVLTAAQVIDGGASATTINFHISGMEIA
jgi:cellulase/cellobiase CelA1